MEDFNLSIKLSNKLLMLSYIYKIFSKIDMKKIIFMSIPVQAIIICFIIKLKLSKNKKISNDRLGLRSKEIVRELVTLYPELKKIILSYDAPCFIKSLVQYDNDQKQDFNNMSPYLQNFPPGVLKFSICRNLICSIITLKNGLLATCTFRGLVYLWDPLTGTIVNRFEKLEWFLNQIHEPNPQMSEMLQMSDNVIAIITHNVYNEKALHRIHFLNVENDTMYNDPYFRNQYRKSRDLNVISFFSDKSVGNCVDGLIIVTENRLETWKINNNIHDKYIYTDEYESFSIELIEKDFQIMFGEMVELLSVICMIIIGQKRASGISIEKNFIIAMDKLTQKTKKYFFGIDEKIIGKPLIVGYNVLITMTDKQTCKSRKYIIFNLVTFQPTHILDSMTNKLVEHIVWLKDNFVALYVLENQNFDDKRLSNKIFILDIVTRIEGQTIDIGDEKIRSMTSHLNGFTTVSYLSEIKTYYSTP